ncbi:MULTISPECIES: helix-turn-helix domain-containing protein [Gordonia]|uniref:helix-turn-helix domain-containing protein n=1 Tax=Gordonia TaxID=2053 RepID=UPI0007EA6EDA|nr:MULTISPECIES: helix-turn-helix transcriptional regulator [Gordonia]OBA72689.1 XRE family transcriptional regulator [Gordonia sp. 852002-10350_SCH5691597]
MNRDAPPTPDADVTAILDAIGPRLRRLRQQRRLSLETVANDAGLTASTLSRLEVGKRRPTLDLLIPLAGVYRVSLDQLIAPPPSGDPRVHLTPFRHDTGSVVIPLTGYPGRIQVFKQVLSARAPKLVTHPGYEWLYVLAGTLRVIVAERDEILTAGEVAEFDTAEPHWFGPADNSTVEILHLFGPHGDQPVRWSEGLTHHP